MHLLHLSHFHNRVSWFFLPGSIPRQCRIQMATEPKLSFKSKNDFYKHCSENNCASNDKVSNLIWKNRVTLILCTFLILETSIDSKHWLLSSRLSSYVLPRLLTEYSIREYYKYSQEIKDNTADAVKLINCFSEKSVLQHIFLKGLENDVNFLLSHSWKNSLILKCIFGSMNTLIK